MNITTKQLAALNVSAKLEPAYRELAHDERIRGGDEFYAGGWHPASVTGWTPAFYGYQYRRPLTEITLDVRPIHTKQRPLPSRQMSLDGRKLHVLDFPIPEPAIPKLRLEVGKRYVQRNGRVTDPLRACLSGRYPFSDGYNSWTGEGGYCILVTNSPLDIVAEYDEPAIPNPEPGDGYRFLEVGELILDGDWVYDTGALRWVPTCVAGYRVCKGSEHWFRRKITTDPLSEVLKTLKEISADSSQSSKKIEALIAKLETK